MVAATEEVLMLGLLLFFNSDGVCRSNRRSVAVGILFFRPTTAEEVLLVSKAVGINVVFSGNNNSSSSSKISVTVGIVVAVFNSDGGSSSNRRIVAVGAVVLFFDSGNRRSVAVTVGPNFFHPAMPTQ